MMATSHSLRVALDTEITATVDALAQLLDANQCENDGPEPAPEPVHQLAEQLNRVGVVAGEQGLFGLHDVCALFEAGLVEVTGRGRPLGLEELGLLAEWPDRVIDYLDTPQEISKGRALADLLSRPEWIQPITDEEASMLGEMLIYGPGDAVPSEFAPLAESEDSIHAARDQSPIDEIPSKEDTRASGSDQSESHDENLEPAGVHRELVALLEAEVQDIAPTFNEMLNATTTEERSSLLEALAEVIGRMAEAADAVEMPGLGRVCVHTGSNLAAMAENAGETDASVLEAWPAIVLAYLAAPDDVECCRELVGYLQLPDWPYELPGDLGEELTQSLLVDLSDAAPEPTEERQTQATDADTSLSVPEDVNQELLESLLLELPTLTAQFSAAIHHLNQGDGNLEDLTTAQRAAHTLKGAANTVGVAGIATLAHHVEDILQAMAKQGELPAGPLAECLIDTSDCLEMMAESLLGVGEAPTEARAVLQQVLDWANWIDRNGLPAGPESRPAIPSQTASEEAVEEGAIDTSPVPSEETVQPSSTTNPAASLPAARTSPSQADELLRLSGELNILHGQLTNRLDRALEDVSAWQENGNMLQQLAIDLEQMVDMRGITWAKNKGTAAEADEFDPLEMDQYNELHTLSRRLMEAASDARELGQEVNRHFDSMKALFVAQSRLQRDNEATVLQTRMVPAKTVVARLQRSVRQTCRVTGKRAELQVIGADTLIDSEVLNELIDPLMHLLRNAVDHGIESPQDRGACRKPETGSITLELGRSGTHIMVRCHDDGAGLDLEAIRQKAEQHKLIQPGQPLSNEELARLILRPGFSTRNVSSQVSGRGIGMDAVYHGVQKLKGSLQLRSEPGAGLVVELLLPASLLSSHGVLVRIASQTIAISSRGVEQILPAGAGELGRLGDFATYKIGEDVYEAINLEALLHADNPAYMENPRPALLVRDSAGVMRAVLVEAVLESRTLVVKSMGEYVPKLQGIAGATILGDGSVAPVIDLETLVREHVVEPVGTIAHPADKAESVDRGKPRALVVDDSLSARHSMTQLLEDAGFEVDGALDGMDAVAAMQEVLPDILTVDLEMPRMNGLELTRHIRGNAATRHLPIIMVTSRSTDKHRREAEAAGVNAYFNKPYAEDELLGAISDLTALRGAA